MRENKTEEISEEIRVFSKTDERYQAPKLQEIQQNCQRIKKTYIQGHLDGSVD